MQYVRRREGFKSETPEEDKRKESRMQEKGRKTLGIVRGHMLFVSRAWSRAKNLTLQPQ